MTGRIVHLGQGGYVVESDTDVQGIAPGQYAIIYTPDKKLCLGSGMISLPESRKKKKHYGESQA
jgi:tRNA-specific 2-thiouridylase